MTAINESQTAKGFTPAADAPGRTIEHIDIHHWGATGQKHEDVVNFFVNGPGATSAHFVVSEGKVTCLVSPDDVAWHAGSWEENLKSIGIECRPEASDGDYREVAQVVAWLRSQHGDLSLHPHREFHATACPGVWDLNRINELASGSTSSPPQGTNTSEDEVTPAQMQEIKVFIQACVNDSIDKMWATSAVTQTLIQQVAAGLNSIKTGAVDVAAVAKAVNDDAAKRMEK